MTTTIDMSTAEYLDDVPSGATVGMACRTTGGEWFFLNYSAGTATLSDELKTDNQVLIAMYPDKFGGYKNFNGDVIGNNIKPLTYTVRDGVSCLGVNSSIEINANYQYLGCGIVPNGDAMYELSEFTIFYLDDGDLDAANFYWGSLFLLGTQSNGAGRRINTYFGGSQHYYDVLATLNDYAVSGWNYMTATAEQTGEAETTLSLYINGVLVGQGTIAYVTPYSSGNRAGAITTSNSHIAVCVKYSRILSVTEQARLFVAFKDENSIG